MNNFEELYQKAFAISAGRQLTPFASCGGVGAALKTKDGNIYTGICIDTDCSLGFCAEHAAVAEMLKSGESEVVEMLAVKNSGTVIPPCGRCRELLLQIHANNKETLVHVAQDRNIKMFELLPESWLDTSSRAIKTTP
ncbi:MAG: cytidine deaminase [Patescibacteria group bacterium]